MFSARDSFELCRYTMNVRSTRAQRVQLSSSLSLQAGLFFHAIFLFVYFLGSIGFFVADSHPWRHSLTFALVLISFFVVETARLYAGVVGNLSDSVPLLSACILLGCSFTPAAALMLGWFVPWAGPPEVSLACMFLMHLAWHLPPTVSRAGRLVQRNTLLFMLGYDPL
eukprot:TRINITY_DN7292_c0_g1_i1.p2 TRINITY_DN7292_c0_g1~~TRINITY_DN7292_c0_g1_i1.p2  ORF type:complete len:168 (-),score=15.26 TRINITY_DN7292_c0_g1_i1:292-795(-)